MLGKLAAFQRWTFPLDQAAVNIPPQTKVCNFPLPSQNKMTALVAYRHLSFTRI